ncbi:MAG: RNA methyltransferase [Methanomicrobiales archaeon]|nr:RNA methyltransferase [Methanomicrobiales archaeon]NYT21274.1 RNA methyltransferase [Methanomicrobiales archaeon]
MKLIAELSGEHPGLPFAELDLIGEVLDRRPQVAVVDCRHPDDLPRLSLTHALLEYIGECEADRGSFTGMLRDLALNAEGSYAARVKKIEGSLLDEPVPDLERLMGSLIGGRVRLENPDSEYRAVCSGDRCYLGRLVRRIDRGSYEFRRPGSRAFFHPGVMMPRMARALVNISLVRREEILLDPFCGTGGMVLEADLIGAQGAGSDIDPFMVAGSRRNVPEGFFFRADAGSLPIRSSAVHAVATDLPYGQSVSIAAGSLDLLYGEALEEIRRVLIPRRRAVVVTHRDISRHAGEVMEIIASYSQRVHRSLTRRILVLRK